MRANPHFKNWNIPEKIDRMCAFMENMSKAERKALSILGAVRLSRKDAIKFMHSNAPTQFYHTVMITCTNGARQYALGYIMYEDMGKQ
eukprot:1815574-Heterocapsa_arctica.AAC.1